MKQTRFLFSVATLALGLTGLPLTLSAIQIAQTSHNTFFMDTGQTPFEPRCAYASYMISNTTTAAIPDVWVQIGPFGLPSNLGVSSLGSNTSHLGSIAANSSKTAYFYICGTVTGNAVSITYTVAAYPSPPPVAAFVGGTQTFTFIPFSGKGAVQDTIQAASNQVSAILSGPNPPTIGGFVSLTVSGSTGTIGGANLVVFSPATGWDWPANTLQLISTRIMFSSPAVHYYNDALAISISYTPTSNYEAYYTFRAMAATVTNTTATPVNYIASGANFQHTKLNAGAYASGSGSIQVISPPQNTVSLTATAVASSLTYPATTLVTVRVTNSGSYSVDLDGLKLAVSAPGPTAAAGTSTFNGSAISDPITSSGQVLWSGIYTIPASSFRDFTYQLTVSPPNTGAYYVSQTAVIGTTSIDTTLSLADNAPAAFGISMTLPLSLTATAGAASTVYSNPVSVTVRLSNSGPSAISIDSFNLAVPTSPGQPAAVTGTSVYNGVSVADPVASSGLITWLGAFSVPAGGFRDLFYYLNFPASAGFFFMSQTANVNGAIIDLTQNSNDTAPATFGITQLMPTATPTSSSTATPTFTATPSSTSSSTSSATPTMTASPSVTRTLTPVACHVMISAITSQGSSANDKVIQLYYSCGSGACLDISGWKIRDLGPGCASVTDLFTFPASSVIKPNTYILLATGSYLAVSYGAGSQAADYTTLAVFGGTGRAIQLWNGTYAEDLVGINSSVCAEGTSVGAINSAQIARRNPAGTDTDSNSADFAVGAIGAVTLLAGGNVCVATPTSTSTRTSTVSPSGSPSFTSTITGSPSFSATSTATPTGTGTQTPTSTVSPTLSNTQSFTSGPSPTFTSTSTSTATPTHSPTSTDTTTMTATPTGTSTGTSTASPSSTSTGTSSISPSPSFTSTATPSFTGTSTQTSSSTSTHSPTSTVSPTFSVTETFTSGPSPTFTQTPTSTGTPTHSPTGTGTGTMTATPTDTSTGTSSATPSATATGTSSISPSPSFTGTATPSFTATPTQTSSSTSTHSPTSTVSPTFSVTETFTSGPSPTFTSTSSSTATPTHSPTSTDTASMTATPTGTSTGTPTDSPSATSTATASATPSSSSTQTPTATPSFTATETSTISPSSSATPTITVSPFGTSTNTPLASFTSSITGTSTETPSTTATETATATETSTSTGTPTATPTATDSPSPSFTATASPTETATASPSATTSITPSATDTDTFTAVATATDTSTPTATPSITQSHTASPTFTTVPTSFPTPVFSSVTQDGTSSSGGFTITVIGSGFVPGAQIWVDGVALVTTYVDANTLVATAPAHGPGNFNVQVSNQGPVFAVLSGSVRFVGPPEDLLLAPMPVHKGQPLCLYSEQPLADSQWTVFGADQQVVARLSSGDAKPCFTRTGDLVPGVYIVRIRTRTRAGATNTVVRNLVIEP